MTKIIVRILTVLMSFYTYGQTSNIAEQVSKIKTELAQSEKGEKLILLDSIARLVEFDEDYGYTELANETVTLALELDSLRIATRMVADQMFYQVNILNKPTYGLEIYESFIGKADALKDYSTRANLHLYAGDAYKKLGDYDQAIKKYEIALNMGEMANNPNRIAIAIYRLGFTKGHKGEFASASKDLSKAYTMYTSLKDTVNMINCKNALSILYSQNLFYEEAEKEREEAIKLSTKDDGSLYTVYYNAGADAREQGNIEDWILNLKKSFAESEKTIYKDVLQPNILNNLVIAHATANDINKAEEYLKIIESNPDKYTTGIAEDYYIEARKNLALAKKNYDEAISLEKEHLQRKKNEQSFVENYNAENFLAKVYYKIGDTNTANIHKNEYYRIKDSVSSAQKIKSLIYYQTLYETEKRDATIALQKANIVLLDEKNTVRNLWFLIIAIAAGVLFTLFFIRNRYKQKLQRRVAIEQLKTKISTDLHDDVGSVLTGLAMQSELIERQVPEENKEQLRKVSSLSRAAMLQMRDAVWAMDARKDNWNSLTDRIKEFASENLQTKEIKCNIQTTGIDQTQELPGAIRQNLYLITKEAIANVL